MAQIKLLKLDASGLPLEMDQANDDITLNSFAVDGTSLSIGSSGLSMGALPISNVTNIQFNDPTADTINQTAGTLVIDDIMAVDRDNAMSSGASILFASSISDLAGEVDAFRLPHLTSGNAPTANPTATGGGFLVESGGSVYVWDEALSSWNNLGVADSAENLQNDDYVAGEGLTSAFALYISGADEVSKAQADSVATSEVIGFNASNVTSGAAVTLVTAGRLDAFSGLTAGTRYYLDPDTAGEITDTVPTTSGDVIMFVGYAKNSTTLEMQFQYLGRRS